MSTLWIDSPVRWAWGVSAESSIVLSVDQEHTMWGNQSFPPLCGAGLSTISILHSRRQTEVKTWRKEVFRSELLMFSDILWLKDRQGHITGRSKSDIFFWTLLYLTCASCSLLLNLSLRRQLLLHIFHPVSQIRQNHCLIHLSNQKHLVQCLEIVSKWTLYRRLCVCSCSLSRRIKNRLFFFSMVGKETNTELHGNDSCTPITG